MTRLLTVQIARDEDVVLARQRARQLAQALGFDPQDQTRIATAVSELARNVARYAGRGSVEFELDADGGMMSVNVIDKGPGIADLQSVLDGTYKSQTGMGIGISGARRIMDAFEVRTDTAGTVIRVAKRIPRRRPAPAPQEAARIAASIARQAPQTPLAEVEEQSRELLAALDELRLRQDDLARLRAELEDTNRGVVALYAELDEKADHLRRADEMKSKFLSNMTHEFQTPLNSILALTRLLLDRADGDLSSEQERQVKYVREATEDLSELVHDLLDIAKVEAGKVTVRPSVFTVADLFGTLRGLMRPLQTNDAVSLHFDTARDIPPLFTDEGKVAQILRNYISNALKFTEKGEVRVTAAVEPGQLVRFSVEDTGIGIALGDQDRLFMEFGQVPNRLQASVRGTGLGLSLSKRLAELLGGDVGVLSAPGEGSTFWLRLPRIASGFDAPDVWASTGVPESAGTANVISPRALVIDDEQTSRYLLRRCLTGLGLRVTEATGGSEGLARAAAERPDVILLDLTMPDMVGTEVLARLKRDPQTAHIPVIISTSRLVTADERERLHSHVAAVVGKNALGADDGVAQIRRALESAHIQVPQADVRG